MPTKPYSLQSPEQIAKDYAGNKQKIAQAAQSGLLDPTAAVMAGMFIDRMRSAQTQEQGPPSTVAQQVFAPPPPPMQMGAMPPSAPMGAPPQGAPPPPMGAPPVGMAGGGLTTLPLPDNMFNEPDGMGYANGGIVAFAQGDAVATPAAMPQVDAYGRPLSLQGNMALMDQLMGPAPNKYAAEQERYYEQLRSPEAQAARKKQDLWGSLAQIGFGMAGSNSPYFLQAAGQAGAAALPGMQAAAKDRRMEQQQALDRLAGIEGQRYNAKGQRIQSALTLQGQAITTDQADKVRAEGKRQFDERLAFDRQDAKDRLALGYAQVEASGRGSGSGSGDSAGFKDTPEAQAAAARYAQIMLRKDVEMAKDPKLRAAYLNNPQKYDAMYEATARRRAYEYAASLRRPDRDEGSGIPERMSGLLDGTPRPQSAVSKLPPGVTVVQSSSD